MHSCMQAGKQAYTTTLLGQNTQNHIETLEKFNIMQNIMKLE